MEAVVGRRVHLSSVEASELRRIPGLRPAAVGRLEMDVSRDGTVRPRTRRVSLDRNPEGLTPADEARLAGTLFQGEKKSAVLELHPLRYDGSRGELLLAGRLRVRLAFEGVAPGETASTASACAWAICAMTSGAYSCRPPVP